MKLNRNNYEEYFILYLDNELDSEGRREVEAFAKQNPDLKAELDMLMQSKLTPDAEISFTDKGALMRFDSSSISLSNYEEWLTSYIDNELTDGERRDVEVFVAGNPAIQRELNLLQQTKLQPETIVFPNKESLYRREEKARVISVRWWRIAAAAVLFLGIGTTTIILMNNQKKNGPVSPTALHPEVKSKSNETVKQPEKGTQSIPEVAVVGEKKNDSNKTDEPKIVVARIKQEDNKQDQKKESNYPAIAIITKDDKSPDKSTQSGNNVTTTTKPENN